jgi:DNA-directed RNA polymerase specialized sigma24 family protein
MARRDGLGTRTPVPLRSCRRAADARDMSTATDRAPAEVLQRARTARERLEALKAEQDVLVAERDRAIRELSSLGLSYDAIADVAGVSRARVGQIVTRPPRREG